MRVVYLTLFLGNDHLLKWICVVCSAMVLKDFKQKLNMMTVDKINYSMKLVDNRLNRLEKNLQQGKMIQEI
jgi:hypothetical protein